MILTDIQKYKNKTIQYISKFSGIFQKKKKLLKKGHIFFNPTNKTEWGNTQ